ncbi:Uncharacterized protein HZ326_27420 [Fusarium oxysporum f. sp. albedinis]|nr:Uncharacterized protein HZ326_27420 [Fusarium oxysporum f. sp. albedinis]
MVTYVFSFRSTVCGRITYACEHAVALYRKPISPGISDGTTTRRVPLRLPPSSYLSEVWTIYLSYETPMRYVRTCDRCRSPIRFGSLMFFTMEFVVYFVKTTETAWLKRGPKLHYRLTEGQAVAMMDAVHTASEMSGASGDGQNPDHAEETRKRLDDKCLILMVSLLDHKLYGDVYDSIVVSFLAVMGIRQDVTSSNAQKLSEAAEFTPKLSALIKMGQLLVAERALLAVELDEADVPAHALEEMQDRFMTKDARSPISWSLKLRAYGKAVKDNTTSLGYIMWSDDNEILSYKKMRFSMTGLRDLVSAEVEAAQNQLADLLLVPPDTERKHIVPQVSLRSVVDDPSEGAPGWNFTCHPQNEVLHGHRRWILDRILKEAFFRRDFFDNESTGKWRLQTVGRYLSTVNAFLERLLLLVHITGGQPAREHRFFTHSDWTLNVV